MTWVKLDDQFYDHPKVVVAGREARDLYLQSVTYASRYLTDGFIPVEQVGRFDAPRPITLAAKLVQAGLWDPVDGGFMVHDFLDYNQSAEKTKTERTAARVRMNFRRGSPDVQEVFAKSSDEQLAKFAKSSPQTKSKTKTKRTTSDQANGSLPDLGPSLAADLLEPIRDVLDREPTKSDRTLLLNWQRQNDRQASADDLRWALEKALRDGARTPIAYAVSCLESAPQPEPPWDPTGTAYEAFEDKPNLNARYARGKHDA